MPNEPKYPEHEKLKALDGKSQTCGQFLDWLGERYVFAKYHKHTESCYEGGDKLCGAFKDQLLPETFRPAALLAEFFEIDEDKLEAEKLQILAEQREEPRS